MSTSFKEINDTKCSIVFKTSEFKSTKFVTSNSTLLQNLQWCLNVRNFKDTLYCSLTVSGNNNAFKAKVRTVCRLLKNDGTVATSDSRKLKLNSMKYYGLAFWIVYVSKLSSDCVLDGEITLECDFEILEISGNYPDRSVNFKESNTLSNTALMVGEETFYVNKQILSIQSPVFAKLLDSEDDTEQIVCLKDISPTHFSKFLHLLYNRDVHINKTMAFELLLLAQKFETPVVTHKCEQYIIDTSCKYVPLKDKKMYAEKYGLTDLAKKCEKLEKKANQSTFSALMSFISDKFSYL